MSDGLGYKIEGLRQAVAALNAVSGGAADMRPVMHNVAEIVARRARKRVPVLSGALRATIRSGKAKLKAQVRAGYNSARLRYAAVIHYGWPKRGIPANPWMEKALAETQEQALEELSRGMDRLLRTHRLK